MTSKDRNDCKLLGWFKKCYRKYKESERAYNLLLAILSIVVTLWAGRWIFRSEGAREREAMDEATKTRIHLMLLECQYNMDDAKAIFDTCSDDEAVTLFSYMVDDSAARLVFQDPNITNVLAKHQLTLIRAYVSNTYLLNRMTEIYLRYTEATKYRLDDTTRLFRQRMRNIAAEWSAAATVLQDELEPYMDRAEYDKTQIERLGKAIKDKKEIFLKEGVNLSK